MAADTPHFSLPFRLVGDTFAVNEQDSVDDVADCVEIVLRYHPGEREMLPEFGTPELVFMSQPIEKTVLLAAIDEWEPRAQTVIAQMEDFVDPLVAQLILAVTRGATDG